MKMEDYGYWTTIYIPGAILKIKGTLNAEQIHKLYPIAQAYKHTYNGKGRKSENGPKAYLL